MRGGTEHATKEMNWAIPWKGQPEHENQISFKTLIIGIIGKLRHSGIHF